MHQPPKQSYRNDTHQDNAIIIHRRSRDRQRRREAEDHIEEHDQDDGDSVDVISRIAHPERTRLDVLPAGEEMAADGESVGDGREDDEGADQVGECGLATERDGAKGRGHDAGEDGGGDGAREALVDEREEAGEGRGVVARERPPGAADG